MLPLTTAALRSAVMPSRALINDCAERGSLLSRVTHPSRMAGRTADGEAPDDDEFGSAGIGDVSNM